LQRESQRSAERRLCEAKTFRDFGFPGRTTPRKASALRCIDEEALGLEYHAGV
jgi:hypothetical protein